MRLFDSAVRTALDTTESQLNNTPENQEEEKHNAGYHVLRFVVSTIWVILTAAGFLLSVFCFLYTGGFYILLGIDEAMKLNVAVTSCLVLIGIITFIIPFLRKKGTVTRSCGIFALVESAWLLYCLFSF